MDNKLIPKLVPASLVRLRCFLNRRGMKVKPWLGPEAVLSAFFATLRSQEKNDAFWKELAELLRDLSADLKQRVMSHGWGINNELLDPESHERLIAEIRSALGDQATPQELKPFAVSLPRAAGALLLMLAAAIAIGCGGDVTSTEPIAGGAGGQTTSTVSAGGVGGAGGQITSGLAGAGGLVVAYTCPPSGLNASDFADCNAELVAALIPYDLQSDDGRQLLECACLLNQSWQTGLAELFSGLDCLGIASYLDSCGRTELCYDQANGLLPSEFDQTTFVECSSVVLYYGVRID